MLKELRIKNFAIVEDQTLEFGQGMTAFTGETGAGKSLLLEAITLLLGAKTRSHLVRQGCASVEVEGVFDLSQEPAQKALAVELGFEIDPNEGDLLFVRREFSSADPKKNRTWIQGKSATRAELQRLLGPWVEISGQHEFLRLTRDDFILEILDDYGELHDELRDFQACHLEHQNIQKRLHSLLEKERSREQRLDYLHFQIEELEKADINESLLEEEPQLVSLRERLASVEKIRHAFELANSYIHGWDSEDPVAQLGILGQLQKIQNEFRVFQTLGQDFEKFARSLDEAVSQILELKTQSHALAQALEIDPEALERTEERLTQIKRLKRKYSEDTTGLLRILREAQGERKELENSSERLDEMRERLTSLQEQLHKRGEKLHKHRREAAAALQELWQEGIRTLGMKEAQLNLEVERSEELRLNGLSRARALFSANPGVEPQTLGRVASGGELSRILLALKQLVASQSEVNVYLFDEVDTGIGGETAQIVGQKLRSLSKENQVLVVTHLAQIASAAHTQFRIEKKTLQGKTRTRIEHLDSKARVSELSRMLGATSSDAASKLARELLKRGQSGALEAGERT